MKTDVSFVISIGLGMTGMILLNHTVSERTYWAFVLLYLSALVHASARGQA